MVKNVTFSTQNHTTSILKLIKKKPTSKSKTEKEDENLTLIEEIN